MIMATSKPKAAVSWSGGKDSYLAFRRARADFDIQTLLTIFTDDGSRSRSHGLRPEIVSRQAELLGLPVQCGRASWKNYELEFKRLLHCLAAHEYSHVIFGDIFLDEHKAWVERVSTECGVTAVEPLWGCSTTILFHEFLDMGAKAQIVAANAALLDRGWLGQVLDAHMLPILESLGVDACGEHGEYHTILTDAQEMRCKLELRDVGHLKHDGYWLLDLVVNYP
ncbi:MAG TPA: diphthine--ammonia ligase [Gammaproteobacteria bacterium]|nr:diphthine--ammonia ligase [Gammaproteobacteria bacterium]